MGQLSLFILDTCELSDSSPVIVIGSTTKLALKCFAHPNVQ